MPTYEYECTKCGGQFEYFQSMKEEPKAACEECGGPLVRLLSAGTGLIFKGSGFYITDYKPKAGESKGDGGESSKVGEGSTPAQGDGKGAGKSGDAKPAAAGAAAASTAPSPEKK